MINIQERHVAELGFEFATSNSVVKRATDCVVEPGVEYTNICIQNSGYISKNNLDRRPVGSGSSSQQYYLQNKIETRSHRSPDKVIFHQYLLMPLFCACQREHTLSGEVTLSKKKFYPLLK